MTRKRRSPEEAKAAVLMAATELALDEGPGSIKIARVARAAGMTHPTVLHHFGSAEGLLTALHSHMARQVREDFLSVLKGLSAPEDRLRHIDQTLSQLSDPRRGRLLAYLVASGVDPFPPASEGGLSKIFAALELGSDPQQAQNVLLLALLSMYGEGLFGDALRQRLGIEQGAAHRDQFRRWMLRLLAERR